MAIVVATSVDRVATDVGFLDAPPIRSPLGWVTVATPRSENLAMVSGTRMVRGRSTFGCAMTCFVWCEAVSCTRVVLLKKKIVMLKIK